MPILAENRKARFDYEILDTLEAGLVLTGPEVKSAKQGGMSLVGSFVTFHNSNAFITGAQIRPYQPAAQPSDYEAGQSRRLLLHRREIRNLQAKAQEQGLTIIPLKVYTNHRLIKIEIAVAKGRKTYDKREAIKKREVKREIRKTIY